MSLILYNKSAAELEFELRSDHKSSVLKHNVFMKDIQFHKTALK